MNEPHISYCSLFFYCHRSWQFSKLRKIRLQSFYVVKMSIIVLHKFKMQQRRFCFFAMRSTTTIIITRHTLFFRILFLLLHQQIIKCLSIVFAHLSLTLWGLLSSAVRIWSSSWSLHKIIGLVSKTCLIKCGKLNNQRCEQSAERVTAKAVTARIT